MTIHDNHVHEIQMFINFNGFPNFELVNSRWKVDVFVQLVDLIVVVNKTCEIIRADEKQSYEIKIKSKHYRNGGNSIKNS